MVDPLDPSNMIIYKDINPADYNLNNPSFSQDYNINMSGGNDRGVIMPVWGITVRKVFLLVLFMSVIALY